MLAGHMAAKIKTAFAVLPCTYMYHVTNFRPIAHEYYDACNFQVLTLKKRCVFFTFCLFISRMKIWLWLSSIHVKENNSWE